MSLKNQPEFETETTTTTTKETEMKTETKIDAGVTASTASTASTAIARASASAVTAGSANKLTLAFADKHGVFDPDTVEGLSLAIPRIKGEQGSLFADKDDLGARIMFEIVSISPRWTLGTGTDDKEAKELLRFSYDNRNTTQGEDVQGYLDALRAKGYNNAKKTEYLDIFGFVISTANGGEIPVEQRQLHNLQCAPTSKGAFVAFSTTRGLLESRGLVAPLGVVEVHAEKRVSGTNRYTNFSFHAPV